MAWRGGDFSTLFNAAGQQVTIYDPLTVNTSNGNRQPFAGPKIGPPLDALQAVMLSRMLSAFLSSMPSEAADTEPAISISLCEARVSFVPHLRGPISKKLIRRGVADSGIRNRNAQVI
jgi:hypothetical protein